jgi:hypothetical protein
MRKLAALLLLASAVLAGGQNLLVDSSHAGPVNDLVYDPASGLLFSAGQDGTVRIWEPEGRLRASLRVSHRPVQRLALHPSLPQFSALVGEASKTETLAAWDWERGDELFSLTSDRQLMHLAYAPQGNYLAYSRADYRSLAAVDSRSGADLGLLRTGFGIVSFFAISRNGSTIMGYQPSGLITYWDLQADRSLRQLRTLADLSLIRITPSNRHILAAAGDRLVAVDLLSGALAAEEDVPGLARLALAPEGEELAADSADGLRRWHFTGSTLAAGGTEEPPGELPLTALAYGSGGLYAGDQDGNSLGGRGTRRSGAQRDPAGPRLARRSWQAAPRGSSVPFTGPDWRPPGRLPPPLRRQLGGAPGRPAPGLAAGAGELGRRSGHGSSSCWRCDRRLCSRSNEPEAGPGGEALPDPDQRA